MNTHLSDSTIKVAIDAIESMLSVQRNVAVDGAERAVKELRRYRDTIRASATVTEPEWRPL